MKELMSIVDAVRAVRRLDDKEIKETAREHGMTAAEARVLVFLCNHPEADTAQEIASGRSMPKGLVSGAVESLYGKGLLLRREDSADRRRVHLVFTDAGHRLADELNKCNEKLSSIIFNGFSDEELAMLSSFMDRLRSNAAKEMA